MLRRFVFAVILSLTMTVAGSAERSPQTRCSGGTCALGTTAPTGGTARIEPSESLEDDAELLKNVKALQQAGGLIKRDRVLELLKSPEPAPLELAAVRTQSVLPRDVAAYARKSYLRIGWYYLCGNCERWHLNLAGGYAITADGAVATCYHVLADSDEVKDGCLFAADIDGNVYPVTTVLACSEAMDAAIVRVKGSFTPLALNGSGLSAGDSSFLYSDPLYTRGYFSAGIVNRYFWLDSKHKNDTLTLDGVSGLRLNVSNDWAPGSSGAALLDGCGNAIGHVARIQPLADEEAPAAREDVALHEKAGNREPKGHKPQQDAEDSSSAVCMVLHEAIPAQCVFLLAKNMDSQSKTVAGDAKAALPPQNQPGDSAEEVLEELRGYLDVEEPDEDANMDAYHKSLREALKKFEDAAESFRKRFSSDPARWGLAVLELDADELQEKIGEQGKISDPVKYLQAVIAAADASTSHKAEADNRLLLILSEGLVGGRRLPKGETLEEWEQHLEKHLADYPDDKDSGELHIAHLDLLQELAPERASKLAETLKDHADADVSEHATELFAKLKQRRELAEKPLDLQFTAVDGREVKLEGFRGKVVLLQFWATWCGYCVEEIPQIRDIYDKFHKKGFEVVGISLDEDKGELERFIREKKLEWPQRFSSKAENDAFLDPLGIDAVPELWLLNKDGRIVDFNARNGLEEKVRNLVEK